MVSRPCGPMRVGLSRSIASARSKRRRLSAAMKSSSAPAPCIRMRAGSPRSAAAVVSGVAPVASFAFASAPRSSSSRTICGRFFAAAWCSGVRWCSRCRPHLCAEERGVARDEVAHIVGPVERDRGPEVEPCSMAQEIDLCHVGTHPAKAGRPAEHAERAHSIARAESCPSRPRPASRRPRDRQTWRRSAAHRRCRRSRGHAHRHRDPAAGGYRGRG